MIEQKYQQSTLRDYTFLRDNQSPLVDTETSCVIKQKRRLKVPCLQNESYLRLQKVMGMSNAPDVRRAMVPAV